MNSGKLVFAQVMSHLPLTTFRGCVARYNGEHKVKHFTCLDQFLCLAFAHLPSSTTWAFAARCRAIRWQMPMQLETGASMPTSCNMFGRSIGLRSARHPEKAAEHHRFALRNATNIKSHYVRENGSKSTVGTHATGHKFTGLNQPVVSVRLTLGH